MSQEQQKPRGFANAKKNDEVAKATQQDVGPSPKEALEKLAGKVTVIHGMNDEEFEIVGAPVSQVRANLVDAFNIPGDALTFVNGEQVDGNFILQANMTLEFIKAAGQKG